MILTYIKSFLEFLKKLVAKKSSEPPRPQAPIEASKSTIELWESCEIKPGRSLEIAADVIIMNRNKEKYKAVEARTNVPWYFIACLHAREASLNFKTCLHNGDPLPGPTTHVPRGRGPFDSWESAAVDALKLDGLDKIKDHEIPTLLQAAEKFNGMGYKKRGLLSPYVWSYTTHYERGKYVADGKFDPNAVDRQIGVAAYLKYMKKEGII